MYIENGECHYNSPMGDIVNRIDRDYVIVASKKNPNLYRVGHLSTMEWYAPKGTPRVYNSIEKATDIAKQWKNERIALQYGTTTGTIVAADGSKISTPVCTPGSTAKLVAVTAFDMVRTICYITCVSILTLCAVLCFPLVGKFLWGPLSVKVVK